LIIAGVSFSSIKSSSIFVSKSEVIKLAAVVFDNLALAILIPLSLFILLKNKVRAIIIINKPPISFFKNNLRGFPPNSFLFKRNMA
jgi:hypothetical protein